MLKSSANVNQRLSERLLEAMGIGLDVLILKGV